MLPFVNINGRFSQRVGVAPSPHMDVFKLEEESHLNSPKTTVNSRVPALKGMPLLIYGIKDTSIFPPTKSPTMNLVCRLTHAVSFSRPTFWPEWKHRTKSSGKTGMMEERLRVSMGLTTHVRESVCECVRVNALA